MGKLLHLLRQRLKLIQNDEVARCLEEVHDVIQPTREPVDVLAIERCDEG